MHLENVTYEVRDHIAHVTMNRPETLNTLTAAMIRDIDEAMKTADRDREVRAIVFTGAGRAFSSGHDISGRPREIPPDSDRPGSVEFRFDFEEEYYLEANLT